MISLLWECGSQRQSYCYPLPRFMLLFSWYTHSTIHSWGSLGGFSWFGVFFFPKRETGDNSEFIHPILRLDAARTRLGASESWAPWTPRATHSLWKSNLTSSLVWHCKTKCPNQRAVFSISVTSWVLGSKYETNAATIPFSRPLEK